MRRELGDLVAQTLKGRDPRMGGNDGGAIGRHERVLLLLERLYTAVFGPPDCLQDVRTRRL